MTIKTDMVSKAVAEMIKGNGSKFMTVTFIKKDGTERTIQGRVHKVTGHDGANTTAHIEKYVTVVLNEKTETGQPIWRNVNCETVKRIALGGRVVSFE